MHHANTNVVTGKRSAFGFSSSTNSQRLRALWLVFLVAALAAVIGPPIVQDPHYHQFADQLTWMGIDHPLDVLSNLPFLLLGTVGWLQVRGAALDATGRAVLRVFFGGMLTTFIGSSYYHLNPNDFGLLVDRLGMTLAFAGLLGFLGYNQIHRTSTWPLLWAIGVLGALAAWVSYSTGELRYWALLQGTGLVLVAGFGALRALPRRPQVKWLWVVVAYAVAKWLEFNDHALYDWSQGVVSGHALKHVVAALAVWPLLPNQWPERLDRPKSPSTTT